MSLKNPNWGSIQDRTLYKQLYYCTDYSELNDEEKEFCKTMSIMEEYAVGLDGD